MSEVATKCACGEQATEGELLARLDEILREYKNKPGNLIPVLQIAQGIFGYLPEKVQRHIALALGKSYSEVAGVVGFYAFFSTQPRGKHLARVCLGTACYVRGGKQVLEAMKKELGIEVGQTSADGMFSLEVARCFGACGLAPAMCIDDEVYKRVRPGRIREILTRYYEAGGNGGQAKPKAKAGTKPKARSKAPSKTPSKARPKSRPKTPAKARPAARKIPAGGTGRAPKKSKVGAAKGARRG